MILLLRDGNDVTLHLPYDIQHTYKNKHILNQQVEQVLTYNRKRNDNLDNIQIEQ